MFKETSERMELKPRKSLVCKLNHDMWLDAHKNIKNIYLLLSLLSYSADESGLTIWQSLARSLAYNSTEIT